MNIQPAPQSKSSSNGSPHIKGFNGEAGCLKRHSRDSLVYLTTCKIGHLVEVHLKNGSIYSGIFHAADVEKDFGIILKMASLIKDGILRGHKSRSDFVRKPPSKTFIIPADELVQIVAKDLSVSSDGMLNAVQSKKPVELLTDSSISKSRRVGQERVLKPWVPDEDVPQPQGLEDVFDEPCKRGWDQFKENESKFGVTSTFNEDLYTTKLERGSRTRELEAHAQRIAREIEGETTRDRHVAEERGIQLNEKFDIDEETKYSAVRTVDGFDDSGFDEEDDKLLDTCNDQTFGGSSTSSGQKPASSSGKGFEDGDSRNNTNVDQSCSISGDQDRHLPSEQPSEDFPAPGSSISESQLGEQRKNNNLEVSDSNRSAEESVSGHGDIKEGAKSGGGGTSAPKTVAERERQGSQISGKTKPESSFGQSASRSSESLPGPSTPIRPGVSPSLSVGSLSSSEKSTLNPQAKEFRPSQAPVRPLPPVADDSFDYPAPPVHQMPGMHVDGYGIHQQQYHLGPPVMIYYPGEEHFRPYFHPNAPPQVWQQQQPMMRGQPRANRPPLGYHNMRPPHYRPENPYNQGREQ